MTIQQRLGNGQYPTNYNNDPLLPQTSISSTVEECYMDTNLTHKNVTASNRIIRGHFNN